MESLHGMNVLFSSLVFGNAIAMYLAGLTLTDWLHRRSYSKRLASLPAVHLKPESSKKIASVQPEKMIFRSRSKVLSQRVSLQGIWVPRRTASAVMLARSEKLPSQLFNEAA